MAALTWEKVLALPSRLIGWNRTLGNILVRKKHRPQIRTPLNFALPRNAMDFRPRWMIIVRSRSWGKYCKRELLALVYRVAISQLELQNS